MRLYISLLFYLLQFFSAIQLVQNESQEVKNSKTYQVNRQKLRELWYIATLRALIKAKCRESLPKVQEIDVVLHRQCESDAKDPVELARCAVKLFKARDEESRRQEEMVKKYFSYSTLQQRAKFKPLLKKYVKKKRPPMSPEIWIRIRQNDRRKVDMDSVLEDFQKVTDTWSRKRENIPMMERQRTEETLGKLAEAYEMKMIKENRNKWKREAQEERKKRKVDPLMSLTKTSLDYSKIAGEYFSQLLGKDEALSPHLDNLKRIKSHFIKADKIKDYYSLMDKENSRLYSRLSLPLHSREPQISKTENDVLENVLELINNFAATHLSTDTKLSVLSPRLFSILPEGTQKFPRLLSPNMLSFQNDGIFSLPTIFQVVSSNQEYQKMMLELIMDLSGAGKALEVVLSKMRPEIDEMDAIHYPLMLEMSRHDHNWMRAKRSFSDQQIRQYKRYGYAFLDKEQMELVYDNRRFTIGRSPNISHLSSLTTEGREKELEEQILRLSRLKGPSDLRRRFKRQDHEGGDDEENNEGEGSGSNSTEPEGSGETGGEEGGGHEEGEENHTLRPLAFTNFIGEGEVLEAITLSPYAFITEVLTTEFLVLRTLQPEAFVFSVLSPAALVARILSPTAFRAEILSPRVFYPWVLSPEALITEVLTPRIFEPRVLSPEVLLIKVLSPSIISPNVGSGEMLGVLVLSPNILSPRIASEEYFLVEILSPHILGGPHGKHDSSVISIGGGEHEHDHEAGDEHGAAHEGDIHVHNGQVEGDHAHDGLAGGPSVEQNLNARLHGEGKTNK